MALRFGQSLEDIRKQPTVHGGTHVRRQSVERAERRQLKALTDEFFDGDVDQVGRVAHHLGGLVHCHDRCMPRLSAPCPDLKMRADLLVVPIQGARGNVERRLRRQPQARPYVGDDGERHVLQTWLVAKTLEHLEQHGQRQGG